MFTPGNPSKVRVAGESDEDELMDMCERLHEENGVFRLSQNKVRGILHGALHGPVETRKGIIGVIGEPNQIEGSICLEFGSPYYSDDIGLFELWNFVLPQHRKTNNSRDLISWARFVRSKFDMPLVIGVLSNDRTAAKVRHYRQLMGPEAGAFFIEGARSGHGSH